MIVDANILRLAPWQEPPPIEPGSPEPVVVSDGHTFRVAYRAADPQFPGWASPSVTDYLASTPGEPFGVLEFREVAEFYIGPPGEEDLFSHAFAALGLVPYSICVGLGRDEFTRWVAAFHDELLYVRGKLAATAPAIRAPSAADAIANFRIRS